MLYTIAVLSLKKINLNQCDLDCQQIKGIILGIKEGLRQRQIIESNLIQLAEIRSACLTELDISENSRISAEGWFEFF